MNSNNVDYSIGDLMYSLMKVKIHYESDFNKKNNKLESLLIDLEIRKEKNLEINLHQLEKDVKLFLKELIIEAVDDLLSTIKNRSTKGSEFTEIKIDLERTHKNIRYDDLDIETLESYYEDILKEQRESIKEKIDNEKYQIVLLIIGLVIGFILGIVTSSSF